MVLVGQDRIQWENNPGTIYAAQSGQRQFTENICSEDDLRSDASPRIFKHLKNDIIAHFLTDFYPTKVT